MKDKKLILSISFCFHDSCITLANEEEVLIHLEAERIFRAKHKKFTSLEDFDPSIPFDDLQVKTKLLMVTSITYEIFVDLKCSCNTIKYHVCCRMWIPV